MMSPATIAEFVRSDAGRLFGEVCERYGRWPGDAFDDDVIGYNVAIGLALREQPEPPPSESVAEGGTLHYEGGIR